MIFQKIAEKIKKADKIAIFSHTRPDGDTVGGVLALKKGLESIGKKCACFCDNAIPSRFSFLPGVGDYSLSPAEKYDLYIAVDCGELARLGENAVFFQKKVNTVNIDHHGSNDNFAEINYVAGYASTCEIVFELLDYMKTSLDDDSALCLYVGLSTDTGNFAHSNTDAHVFECARRLIGHKIDVAALNFALYRNTSFQRTKLLGRVLGRMRRYLDGKLTLIYTLSQDIAETGATASDTEGFIDYATNVTGTEVGVAICQHGENSFKVSMRSRGKVDVSAVCSSFGGGGHRNASGCMICGFFEDVVDKIVRAISLEL